MSDIDRQEAMSKLGEVAEKHNLRTSILRDVIEGRSKGMSQREVAETYSHSRNTVSKYNKILDEEMSENELAKLIILAGILIGGSMLLDKITD